MVMHSMKASKSLGLLASRWAVEAGGRRKACCNLVGVGPDLGQQLSQALRFGPDHLLPPTLEEHRVPGLVDHLGREEDLDLGCGRGPHERRECGGDALLSMKNQPCDHSVDFFSSSVDFNQSSRSSVKSRSPTDHCCDSQRRYRSM